MTNILVRLGRRSYPVLVGRGVIGRIGALARKMSGSANLFVVTSAPVRKLHGRIIGRSFNSVRIIPKWIIIPDGEKAKTMSVLENVLRALARGNASRDSIVVALGGGTVGDLAGFAAAVYARGIRIIQVPTTLLAQVDAAIGGKTGLDLPEGKNLAGAFHHPRAVLSDQMVLQTLNARQFRSGLAEVVKYGVIRSPRLFEYLERNTGKVLRRDSQVMARIVGECARIKADIVSLDEHESGVRIILNYGHTVGHAIELVSRFRLLHGEAVSIGMVAASRISASLGMCHPSVPVRIARLLSLLGLPVRMPSGLKVAGIIRAMGRDKKIKNARLRFVLTRSIGGVTVSDSVNSMVIRKTLSGMGGNILCE